MNDKYTPKLRCTKDYSLFVSHPCNRDITKTKELEKSMRKNGFDPGFPIRYTRNQFGQLQVTHGHHRLWMARYLGLPVWFIEVDQDINLFESEATSRSWNIKDFTVARARSGEAVAETVLDYHEATGIPLGDCISLIGGESAGSGNKARLMKTGTFKIGDPTMANMVATIVDHCKREGIPFATNSFFVKAISKCLHVDEFDIETLLHKISAHRELMSPRRGVDGYLELIEYVYNRQSQNKLPIAWMANEASKKRKEAVTKKRKP